MQNTCNPIIQCLEYDANLEYKLLLKGYWSKHLNIMKKLALKEVHLKYMKAVDRKHLLTGRDIKDNKIYKRNVCVV